MNLKVSRPISQPIGIVATDIDSLLTSLLEAHKLRNVICHGSWRAPDAQGASVPLYVSTKNELFEVAIDLAFLRQVRAHTVELIYNVMNTVTTMGVQFPGSNGPENTIVQAMYGR
jgi:hypothetical protein